MTSIPIKTADDQHTRAIAYSGPAYQAYRTLQVAFVVAPIIAGIDKFADQLVMWDKYLAPPILNIVGNAHSFMQAAGVIEIFAGIGIALKPRYAGYVVALWLLGILINLLMTGQYFDIALRDLGLALGAFALARLAQLYDYGPCGGLLSRRGT